MWVGSGFIPILIYASNSGSVVSTDMALLTEVSRDILTEDSELILTQ